MTIRFATRYSIIHVVHMYTSSIIMYTMVPGNIKIINYLLIYPGILYECNFFIKNIHVLGSIRSLPYFVLISRNTAEIQQK